MRISVTLVLVGGSFLLASCSPKALSRIETRAASTANGAGASKTTLKIIGKWLTPTGGSIEFKTDGSATMAGPNGSAELSYRLPNERTIEMTKAGGKSAIRWEILSVSVQDLVVKDADGKEVHLRRGG